MTYAARYAPFGTLLWQQGTVLGPWGFAGEYQDPTGLIYLRARWYDPATGRFLTRDPFPGLAMLPATQHPYVYVGNNPVNLTDPNGQYIESWLDILFIAYDIGSISWDVYQLQQAGGCEKQDWQRQLGIDVGALLLDVAFLALPGVTGGGPGLRLALAGGGHLATTGVIHTGRAVQMGYKGVQVGGQILHFASESGSSGGGKGPKPSVQDPKLQNLVDDLYRPGARIGSGSTADAIRYERATGQRVGGRSHIQKGEDYIRALQRWLRNNPTASPSDRAVAENIIRDLMDALGK